MLVQFTVANWKSFKEPVTLNMVAGKEIQHTGHIQYVPEYKLNVLPVSMVFGGNASGKSNLVKALAFAASFIGATNFDPYEKIAIDPFRLEASYLGQPSVFEFTLIIKEKLYKYSFSLNQTRVLEESLTLFNKGRAAVLYNRRAEEEWVIHKKFTKEVASHLRSVLDNKLALTQAIMQKMPELQELADVYDWFRFSFVVLSPSSRIVRFNDNSLPTDGLSNVLSRIDSGISKVAFEEIPIANSNFPPEDVKEIERLLSAGSSLVVATNYRDEFWKFERREGDVVAKKMVSYHRNLQGEDVLFQIHENSDGTRRCLHLFPAFNQLTAPGSTACYIIDELDRSLHTHLIKQLLVSFLQTRNQDTRSQLIVTNHDVLQMDQDIFRRDEIWIAERDQATGASSLTALNEFKLANRRIRNDLLISKLYLEGQLGGVPELVTYGGLFTPQE